ncbi:tetratricopeptide repeat-containing sensor histidine kinase [Flavobacterium sp.]|uniref:tetratricopeptide repeat-containing sensor histidine kinase n=1 Tax=Flavobacterium sp. TaxID=239 RepID=UPI003B9CE1B2
MQKYYLILFLSVLVACKNQRAASPNLSAKNNKAIAQYYDRMVKTSGAGADSNAKALDRLKKQFNSKSTAIDSFKYAVAYGIHQSTKGSYSEALKQLEDAKENLKRIENDTLQTDWLMWTAICHKSRGDYPLAFRYVFQALKKYEKMGFSQGIARVYGTLGQIYLQKEDLLSAEKYLLKAKAVLKDKKPLERYLFTTHHLANAYGMQGKFDKALALDREGLQLAKDIPYIKVTFLDNKANCMLYTGKLDSAAHYFRECLKVDFQVGNQKQIADSYSNLAVVALYKKELSQAKKYIDSSMSLLQSSSNKFNVAKSLQILIDIHKAESDFKKALEVTEIYDKSYREMINERKEDALAAYHILYETGKKEDALAKQRLQLAESKAASNRKTAVIVILLLIAVLMAIIGFLFYKQQRLKVLQKEKEFQLKEALSVVETQNKLQEQRLEISRDLHDNIGAQLTFIISSVDTTRSSFEIKDISLDTKLQDISTFTKSTILELRDTIWAMNSNEITFEDLRVRLLNFIEKAQSNVSDVSFGFEVDDELKSLKLSSVVGMNVYRTIQEAVNNAIKHSKASEVNVLVSSDEAAIKVIVSDNGIGFNQEVQNFGSGLHNMEKRIEEIGGSFQIISQSENGTRVQFRLYKNLLNT